VRRGKLEDQRIESRGSQRGAVYLLSTLSLGYHD
jgi:hypothetical protein